MFDLALRSKWAMSGKRMQLKQELQNCQFIKLCWGGGIFSVTHGVSRQFYSPASEHKRLILLMWGQTIKRYHFVSLYKSNAIITCVGITLGTFVMQYSYLFTSWWPAEAVYLVYFGFWSRTLVKFRLLKLYLIGNNISSHNVLHE